ncbi:site-specific DNA-methyltransferase [Xanthomonas translucens pv. translucens]|uniref:site-specific DNA-methyltransferase n=1 Tax=Xanthomonas campestris pv. translucens TaxID=343 RepID=UPI0021B72B54|nr:site-specific DNA-methyltransferase [Xanthomonas translucens]MCT8285203.1 site-specific DNA-methyltransferase [Xanthomonas translucens pv. translucens]MCT8302861.1 site-specific DNA-methyltransferase [Xanthomonas translucens pv. translucens]
MTSKYDQLDRQTLIGLLQRRDAERQLGLVWEREEIEVDQALNDDFVALSLDAGLSHGAAPWDNLIIEGDNYDALRALRMTHKGAIRCIYIDPPYNTGNKDFVYNDHFVDRTHRFRHSLWLEFMYQRLQLAKELLADDGVIFVSIDDNELFRLGMLMDRVFGAVNKIGVVIWKNVTDNNPSRVVTEHEYLLFYAKSKDNVASEWKSSDNLKKDAMLRIEAQLLESCPDQQSLQKSYSEWFRVNKDQLPPLDNYKFIDFGGIYAGSRSVHNPGKEGYRYDVIHPETKKPCTQPLMGYRFPQETMAELLEGGRILFGKDHTKLIELKIYLRDYKSKLSSVVDLDGRAGPNELKAMFNDEKVFNNPKPSELIERFLSFATEKNDLVLDFFGGSGTTAHAVTKLNAEDGGQRKFILVSSTEATEDAPDKNLCRDVCAQRVRRVLGGYTSTKGQKVAGLGGGFAYLRAKRIPKHRMALKLDHAEVWSALQLLHGLPLSPWPGDGFAGDGELAYLADFHAAHVQRLRDWLKVSAIAVPHVYSWSPQRLVGLLGDTAAELALLPLPQHLRERFGR